MIDATGESCPLSPTTRHRVYYSARRHGVTAPIGRGACCRDCSVEVYFIANRWTTVPPGEIVVGLMAEFQARVMEGDPDGIRNPRGIFGAAGEPRARILPPQPSIMS